MRIDLTRRGLLAATAAASLTLSSRTWAAGDDIVVGQIGPFTGTPVPGAPEINQGIKAALAEVNAGGGIGGRRLMLFELDDAFKEDGFVRQFDAAMKRRPVALLSPVGTSAVQRMLDDRLLDQNEVLVLNAVPGAESLRNPGHPKLLHIRAGDRQQVERLIRHAETLGITEMDVLYQDVSIGTTGLAIAQTVAAGLKMNLSAVMAPPEAGQVGAAALRVATGHAQSALVLGSPRFAAEAAAALRKAGFAKSIYALSYVSPSLIKLLAGSAGRGVALAQVFPNPNGNTMALQQSFQLAMKRAGSPAPYTAFQLEGYVTARVLVEGLRRAREASPAALARALHTMGDVNLGGFRVDFSKGNVGSSFVDIAVMNGEGRLLY